MPTLLLLFYLILPPTRTDLCALWIAAAATQADLEAACPAGIALEQYQVDFVNIWNGEVFCTANATAIWAPDQACNLSESLDNFRLEIYLPPAFETSLCAIQSYNDPPTPAEVSAVCNWEAQTAYAEGRAELRYIRPVDLPEPVTISLPAPEPGPGLYDQPATAADLATAEALPWLAGRLIWTGVVTPNCDGLSGLDPVTLAANPCGELAAAETVAAWQNQFDAEIYAAALAEGIPPRLLKRVIRIESQYWPMWEQRPAGEVGLAQITLAGADTYLRWYQPEYGYANQETQHQLQAEFLAGLRCHGCSLPEALEHERANLRTYARILKAYRYASEDWRSALVRWNGEAYAERVINHS